MLNFKKNILIGVFLFIFLGIAKTFWGMMSGFVHIWDPIFTTIPLVASKKGVGGASSVTLFILDILFWIFVLYSVPAILRGVGLWVAKDLERARRITRIMKMIRVGKIEIGVIFWRFLIGFFLLADALEDLHRIRTPEFTGKRSWGLITKVQNIHDISSGQQRYEFIVYTGDFPAFFLGRWAWYEVENCEKIYSTVGDMARTFGSVGLAAPSDLYIKKFSHDDLEKIVENLKEKEALLIAAGLLDPDRPIAEGFSEELSR